MHLGALLVTGGLDGVWVLVVRKEQVQVVGTLGYDDGLDGFVDILVLSRT